MKKSIFCFILAVMLTALAVNFEALASELPENESVSVSAQAAALVDYRGRLLYGRNETERLPMASTTKIMTALVALECCEADETVTVSEKAAGTEGTSAYLKSGERLTVKELLYALMLQSANDAASALAIHICGSLEQFAALMNEKAAELSLESTHFTNPHGLYDENHYTTALDLARLAAAALENAEFADIVSCVRKSFPVSFGGSGRTYINHNRLLREYEDVIGVKTGFTKASGRCLVSAAEKNGVRVIAATLNAPSDWRDHARLLGFGLSALENRELCKAGEIAFELPVVSGEKAVVTVANEEDIFAVVKKNAVIKTDYELPEFLYAPVEAGRVIGKAVYYCEGEKIAEAELKATCNIKVKSKSRKGRIFGIGNSAIGNANTEISCR